MYKTKTILTDKILYYYQVNTRTNQLSLKLS